MAGLGYGYPFPSFQTKDNGSNSLTVLKKNHNAVDNVSSNNDVEWFINRIGASGNGNDSAFVGYPSGAVCPTPNQIDDGINYTQCVAYARACQAESEKLANLRSVQTYAPLVRRFDSLAGGLHDYACAGLLYTDVTNRNSAPQLRKDIVETLRRSSYEFYNADQRPRQQQQQQQPQNTSPQLSYPSFSSSSSSPFNDSAAASESMTSMRYVDQNKNPFRGNNLNSRYKILRCGDN